jgi:opacity protein-like surface antigen
MRKHNAILAGFLATTLWTAPLSAANPYVSGNVGVSWLNDVYDGGLKYNLDPGVNALGAVGYGFNCYRIEGEVGYQSSGIKSFTDALGTVNYSGDISAWSLLLNGYYDVDAGGGITPYLTAGAGFARVKFDDLRPPGSPEGSGFSEHETVFAYQLGAGVAVPLTSNIKLDARYRFFSTADYTLDSGNDTHVSGNNILLGLRVEM